jgi:NhaP-type Na+/H+ or K+/H+ antiporter
METNIEYILNSKPLNALFITFDIFLISLVFLLSGFTVSTFLNRNITRELDRSVPKLEIFFEVIAEALVTLVFVLLAMHFIPMLPSILPKPDPQHIHQRIRGKDFLLIFAIVSCQVRFQDKIRYLLNVEEDEKFIIDEKIRDDFFECPNNEKGFVCKP